MTSASGRVEHAMLKIQNFRDSFLELNPHADAPATMEWVMMVGKAVSYLQYPGVRPMVIAYLVQVKNKNINTASFGCTIYSFPVSY